MVENDTTREIWKVLLRKDHKGLTLYGLLEATMVKVDTQYRVLARFPKLFSNHKDMAAHAITQICHRDILAKFNPERAGGEDNLPGYLANQAKNIIRHAMQDELRKISVNANDVASPEIETMQMNRISQGKKPVRYVVSSHVKNSIKSEDGETIREIGTQESDWCGRCDWSAACPVETNPGHSEVFLDKIIDNKTKQLANLVLDGYSIQEAADLTNLDQKYANNLIQQARKKLLKALDPTSAAYKAA